MEKAQEDNEYPQDVASLLLPMHNIPLLLPNVGVAEIVTGNITPHLRTPAWHLGVLDWRSVKIPIISIEGLNNQRVEGAMTRVTMAVINSYRGDKALPFYGFRINGIPRLVRVVQADLEVDPGQTLAAEQVRVLVGGVKAAIPDLDFIERKILNKG